MSHGFVSQESDHILGKLEFPFELACQEMTKLVD